MRPTFIRRGALVVTPSRTPIRLKICRAILPRAWSIITIWSWIQSAKRHTYLVMGSRDPAIFVWMNCASAAHTDDQFVIVAKAATVLSYKVITQAVAFAPMSERFTQSRSDEGGWMGLRIAALNESYPNAACFLIPSSRRIPANCKPPSDIHIHTICTLPPIFGCLPISSLLIHNGWVYSHSQD